MLPQDADPSDQESAPDGPDTGQPAKGEPGPLFIFPLDDGRPHLITFQDMDQDGDKDVVVAAPGSPAYWIENTMGTEAETLFTDSFFAYTAPTALAAGDLNNNAHPDLVIGHQHGLKIFRNEDDWREEPVRVRLDHPQAIVIADVDNDGQADIIVRDSRELVLLKGQSGVFGVQTMSWPDLGSSSLLAVGNFDLSNTTLELLTTHGETGALGMITHNATSWQTFRTIHETAVINIRVQDINNDGLDDVYVEDAQGREAWLISDGAGSFAVQETADPIQETDTGVRGPVFNVNGTTNGNASNTFPLKSLGSTNLSGRLGSMLVVKTADLDPGFDFQAEPDADPGTDPDATMDLSASEVAVKFALTGDGAVNAAGSSFGDHITGDDRANVILGGDGNDWLCGQDGNDTLSGGNGHDWITGGNGNDLLLGGDGDDVLFGDAGDDRVYGGSGDDILFGGNGKDTLLGGSGGDILFGSNGDDVLCGGLGHDILVGGQGSDTFHYTLPDEGGDLITGFTPDADVLEFAFGSKLLHTVHEPYVGILADAGESFVWENTDPGSGKLYYDPDTALAGDEILLAEIELADPADALTIDDISLT
jgi:Ca2+-binding RTX toxin-like protein